MRAVVQRVKECAVHVDDRCTGSIGRGILIYLGVEKGDTEDDIRYLVDKTTGLRIFSDEAGKMNLSVRDISGEILVVSQFTLCADTRKGRRPSYNNAADPEMGRQYYEKFVEALKELDIIVATGEFGARMEVQYINDGPVTILLDSRKLF